MYYPLSQITPNLYTNGEEFTLASDPTTSYVGYYFLTSKGETYTGRNFNDKPNLPLIKYTTTTKPQLVNEIINASVNTNVITNITPLVDYINIKNINVDSIKFIPTSNLVLPTQQDYQNGEFRRYFCKKTNELSYIEINESTYTKLITKDPQIEYALYTPFNISWVLTGDKQKVAQTNKNIVELIMKRQKLYKFNEYLKQDYLKYYQ
jgi:hypothetical protein